MLRCQGGASGEMLQIRGGGALYRPTEKNLENFDPKCMFIEMSGQEVFKYAVRALCECSQLSLKANNIKPEELDWFAPHQANIRIIETTAKKLRVPMDKVLVNVDRYGNTSAGTIPIVLAEAFETGKLKRGQLVQMATFGGGMTWGSALVRW